MSTKTTFKRVAAVAVMALSISGLTGLTANAGQGLASGVVTLASSSSTATVGVETTVGVTFTGYCLGVAASGPQDNRGAFAIYTNTVPVSGTGAITGLALTASTTAPTGVTATQDNATAVAYDCTAAGFFTAAATAKVTLPAAGTYTFKIEGVYQVGGSATWTVVASAPAAISAAGSTVLIAGSTTTPTTTTDAAAVTGSRSLTAPVAANISVVAGNSTTADTSVAGTLSATVSGSGLVAWSNSRAAAARSVAAGAAGKTGTLYVFSDGTSGVGTITISSGSTAIATKTVTFYGSVASLSVTAMAKSVVDTAEGAAATDTDAFVGVVSAKDAAGVTVPVAAADFTVSSTTEKTAQAVTNAAAVEGVTAATYNGVAITATSVVLAVDPTATKTGAKTLTLTHTATTVATTFSFTVALAAATTVAVTNDQASPVPGQKITYTVTAKDAGGNAIPDGSTVAVAVTTSLSQSATLPTTLAFANGVGTFSLFAPVTPGTQTVTVTMNTVAGTTTSDVVDLTAPATDAAAEAIDAANAATDAANAAAEAADAATAAAQDAADAVAALAVQVNEQIAELKAMNMALQKQITALTNLIIKIQKKVKA